MIAKKRLSQRDRRKNAQKRTAGARPLIGWHTAAFISSSLVSPSMNPIASRLSGS